MKCLVTGGTGFIGSNLALGLEERGHEVTITGSLNEQRIPEFKGARLGRRFDALDQRVMKDLRPLREIPLSRMNFLDG